MVVPPSIIFSGIWDGSVERDGSVLGTVGRRLRADFVVVALLLFGAGSTEQVGLGSKHNDTPGSETRELPAATLSSFGFAVEC